jgi:hypothetical protein
MGRYAIRFMFSILYDWAKEIVEFIEQPLSESGLPSVVLTRSEEYSLGNARMAARRYFAVQKLVELLNTYDAIFCHAVRRYRAESDKRKSAPRIKVQEYELGRALWVVSQREGIGRVDDLGFSLLKEGRGEMRDWANTVCPVPSITRSLKLIVK